LSPVCTACGQLAETFYLSISEGGLTCGDCSKDGFKLNLKWLKIIEYLMNKDVRIISNTKIHPNYTQQLIKIFESFLMFHLNIKEIKSNDFLDAIK
jgi:DNA repair protein RecO